MAVCIEPQATPEARLPRELLFGRALDIIDEPAVGVVSLPQHFGKRQVPLLLRHLGVEGIDAAVRDGIPRWLPAVEDERQMLQRLLFPPGHVRGDVSDRPSASDTKLHQLRALGSSVKIPWDRHSPVAEMG